MSQSRLDSSSKRHFLSAPALELKDAPRKTIHANVGPSKSVPPVLLVVLLELLLGTCCSCQYLSGISFLGSAQSEKSLPTHPPDRTDSPANNPLVEPPSEHLPAPRGAANQRVTKQGTAERVSGTSVDSKGDSTTSQRVEPANSPPDQPKSEGELDLSSFGPSIHVSEIVRIFPNPEGTAILSLDSKGMLAEYDRGLGTSQKVLQIAPDFSAVALCGTKKLVATAEHASLRIYQFNQESEDYRTNRVRARVTALAFSPNCDALLIGAADGRLYRWKFLAEKAATNIREYERALERYLGHASVVSNVFYHPFGRAFFSTDWAGVLSVWQAYDLDSFEGGYDENLFGPRFFAEGVNRVIADQRDRTSIEHFLISNDGKRIALGLEDGRIELWKVRGLKLLATIQANTGVLRAMALSADGEQILSVGRDRPLRLWHLREPKNSEAYLEQVNERSEEGVTALAYLSADNWLVGDKQGQLRQLSLKSTNVE